MDTEKPISSEKFTLDGSQIVVLDAKELLVVIAALDVFIPDPCTDRDYRELARRIRRFIRKAQLGDNKEFACRLRLFLDHKDAET